MAVIFFILITETLQFEIFLKPTCQHDFEYFCIDTISIEIRIGIWALSVMLQGLDLTRTAGDLAKYFCCNMIFCEKTTKVMGD